MESSNHYQDADRIEQGVILERLNNLIKENAEAHKKILEQTTKTNGNVSDLQKWKNIVTGALIIMNTFAVPVMLWFIIDKMSS